VLVDVMDFDNSGSASGFFLYFPPQQFFFNASDYRIAIDLTIEAGNTADNFALTLGDSDSGTGFLDEVFIYQFSGLSLLPQGMSLTLATPVEFADFIAPIEEGDGIPNFDSQGSFTHLGIQATLPSPERLNFTLHSLRIEAIPEPSSITIVAFGLVCFVSRRSFAFGTNG